MGSEKLQDWLQIIGLFGVIASLVFVGLQMMQDRDIALSAIYQERSGASAEYLMTLATDEFVRNTLIKVGAGKGESLTEEEMAAYELYISAGIRLLDNSHYQWERGFADPEHWQQMRTQILRDMRIPYERDAYLSRENLRPTFRAVLEEIAREAEREGTNANQ